MSKPHDNNSREKIRSQFAQHRNKGHSIAAACELAGISTSTYYEWNSNDRWQMKGGWSQGGGSKGGWNKGGW